MKTNMRQKNLIVAGIGVIFLTVLTFTGFAGATSAFHIHNASYTYTTDTT